MFTVDSYAQAFAPKMELSSLLNQTLHSPHIKLQQSMMVYLLPLYALLEMVHG